MAKITLLRKSPVYDKHALSYRMQLEILATEQIVKEVFVNQRHKNFVTNTFDDVFAAVATPTQLEDFGKNSPEADSSYFRTFKIDLVSRNIDYLEDVFDSILFELTRLVDEVESLNDLQADAIYEITSDNIETNTAIVHTHYRLPLTAAPCGVNELTDGEHRVGSQNVNLAGWLNTTTGVDPANYKFKYNIEEDNAVKALWPPTADKLQYAHIEVNGITNTGVLLTEAGIFWRDNTEGNAPWPLDYVSTSNTSPSGEAVTIVLDFIV